jgi:hypothetical protein
MTQRQVTQEVVEADVKASTTQRRVSQVVVEVDIRPAAQRQITQEEVEADFVAAVVQRRVSQVIVEVDVNTWGNTPILWEILPGSGHDGDAIKLVGTGLGTFQAQFSGVVKLKDSGGTTYTCTIISWASVAADITQAWPFNVDHEEIVFTIPATAIAGIASVWVEETV